jgi:hypothetical protein
MTLRAPLIHIMPTSWPLDRNSTALNRNVLALLAALFSLAPPMASADRADLDGVWLLSQASNPDDLALTPTGLAAMLDYDPLRDDSDLDCIPVSFTNIMHTPSPPFEIRQRADFVAMNYEFMDVHRRIPLDDFLPAESAPPTVEDHPHLGRSVGRYLGDALIVDTVGVRSGPLDTFAVIGLPQSEQMTMQEHFEADGDVLRVVVTHTDPLNYVRPLVVTYEFLRLDGEILEWGCMPDAAGYQDRLD